MSAFESFPNPSTIPDSPAAREPTETMRRTLRDLVQRRVDLRWSEFVERHPHLAAAVDRVTLVRATVSALIDDPAFQEAMRVAERDAFRLGTAERILDHIDGAVGRVLGL